MFPWLGVWAPHVNFPWSGSVAQTIEPNIGWFFDAINPKAGNGRIEQKAFELASYGKQLGWLTEVLVDVADKQTLSPDAKKSLADLEEVQKKIEEIKKQEAPTVEREAEEKILWLQKHSPDQLAKLLAWVELLPKAQEI